MEPSGPLRTATKWSVVVSTYAHGKRVHARAIHAFADKAAASAEQQAMGLYLYLSDADEDVMRFVWSTGVPV